MCIMWYAMTLNENEIPAGLTTWMNPEVAVFCETSQAQKYNVVWSYWSVLNPHLG